MAKFKKKETMPEAHEELNEILEEEKLAVEVLSPENPEELKEVIEHLEQKRKKEEPKKGFFAPIVPDVIMPEIVKLTEQLSAMNEALKSHKPAAPAATTEPVPAQNEVQMDDLITSINSLKSEMTTAREEATASSKKISTGLWVAGGLIATGLVAGGALYVRHMSNKAGFDGDMTSF